MARNIAVDTVAMGMTLLMFFAVSIGEAQEPLPIDLQKDMSAEQEKSHRTVDCDRGRSINTSLRRLPPLVFDVKIKVRGTCEENIVITRDGVALEGDPTATLVGGIRVVGADRVTITNLTVTDNTEFEGAIEAVEGASIRVINVDIENPSSRGLRVRDSVAEIQDLSIANASTVGFLARGARLTLEGEIDVTDSTESNIVLTDGTSVFSKEGNITSSGGEIGMIIQGSSSFEGVFGSYTATANTFAGLLVATQGVLVYGFDLDLSGNSNFGLWVDEASSVSPFANLQELSTTTLNNNGLAGAFVQRGSTLELAGNTTVSGNPFGVFVEESGLKTVGADISGNVSDLTLSFAARATFEAGTTIGTMTCDTTAVTRGVLACP